MFIEKRIKEEVEKLMRKHRTKNPEEIISNMRNVDFQYETLSDTLNGYYLYCSEKKQIIRVHDNLSIYDKQYVLFHEIGHCVLKHRGVILLDCLQAVSKLKEEYEADLFATYFFILLNGINRENINDFTIPARARDLVKKFI